MRLEYVSIQIYDNHSQIMTVHAVPKINDINYNRKCILDDNMAIMSNNLSKRPNKIYSSPQCHTNT